MTIHNSDRLGFDRTRLTHRLSAAPQRSRTLFALACAERMLSHHERVAAAEGVPHSIFRVALDALWSHLAESRLSTEELEALLNRCLVEMAEVNATAQASHHDDASAAVSYALMCELRGGLEEAASAAQRVTDYVDGVVVLQLAPASTEFPAQPLVVAHTLMQAELERQERDLQQVLLNAISPNELRQRSKTEAALLDQQTQ